MMAERARTRRRRPTRRSRSAARLVRSVAIVAHWCRSPRRRRSRWSGARATRGAQAATHERRARASGDDLLAELVAEHSHPLPPEAHERRRGARARAVRRRARLPRELRARRGAPRGRARRRRSCRAARRHAPVRRRHGRRRAARQRPRVRRRRRSRSARRTSRRGRSAPPRSGWAARRATRWRPPSAPASATWSRATWIRTRARSSPRWSTTIAEASRGDAHRAMLGGAMRFVYVMDPMERVLPDKDTTFAFQRAAQRAGHVGAALRAARRYIVATATSGPARATVTRERRGPSLRVRASRATCAWPRSSASSSARTRPSTREYLYITLMLEKLARAHARRERPARAARREREALRAPLRARTCRARS